MSHFRWLLLALTIVVGPAAYAEADSTQHAKKISNAASISDRILKGSAAVERSIWQKHHEAGTKALDQRQYGIAREKLSAAIAELRKYGTYDTRMLSSKLALAETLLADGHTKDAERYFTETVLKSKQLKGQYAPEHARALTGLAQAQLANGKDKKAEATAREALTVGEKALGGDDRMVGLAHKTLAKAFHSQGLEEDAIPHFKKAIAIFEEKPGPQRLDLAEALYDYGIVQNGHGNNAEGAAQVERALIIKDRATVLHSHANQVGQITYEWEKGNPRSRQIHDQYYPLKYINANGLRVAATVIDSGNVIGAIVSLANCTRQRLEVGVGPVSMVQLEPQNKRFVFVEPVILDMPLEAEHISNLTWRRRWLNHIQKTRHIPGYLKDGILDPDNFFGNNTFALSYGEWGTLARSTTPIVTREQFLYSPYLTGTGKTVDSADFLNSCLELKPTYLDPGESKTGLVFFQRERFESAKLKVVIGNAQVIFPFSSAGPR
jgi:tetratricopeptide (TPR) repeat protein